MSEMGHATKNKLQRNVCPLINGWMYIFVYFGTIVRASESCSLILAVLECALMFKQWRFVEQICSSIS